MPRPWNNSGYGHHISKVTCCDENRVDMEHESSVEVATTFLKRFSDGDFEKADDLIHPEGPMEVAG